ncbi:TetR/AcrR family transcriptional regulator [Flavobacterium soyangense]|uniref:TetR/AcrR family transcriptional regulator n=1 Tax=Flavobacterium soyangense TaxID=2023265 RepID=A0A930XV51_9FLAO|nr:TetR/AcrR family transcriptional regulator [Flavobacterium soyangense]MBF2707732.1 TetR/AcrR family transcriptional regulator [Flavobacterium soyangense]
MRPQKVEDKALLIGLMSVLSSKGYDGSSLNELAESSGLQKASLYHRFPAGKKEITSAVLNYVNEWIHKNIYLLLINQSITPAERLNEAIKNINNLYNDGESICILRSLSMNTGIEIFGEQIKETMQLWINGFTAFGKDCGYEDAVAQEKAYQVLVNIQGSLIVSKGLNSTNPYKAALKSIQDMYKLE